MTTRGERRRCLAAACTGRTASSASRSLLLVFVTCLAPIGAAAVATHGHGVKRSIEVMHKQNASQVPIWRQVEIFLYTKFTVR